MQMQYLDKCEKTRGVTKTNKQHKQTPKEQKSTSTPKQQTTHPNIALDH